MRKDRHFFKERALEGQIGSSLAVKLKKEIAWRAQEGMFLYEWSIPDHFMYMDVKKVQDYLLFLKFTVERHENSLIIKWD